MPVVFSPPAELVPLREKTKYKVKSNLYDFIPVVETELRGEKKGKCPQTFIFLCVSFLSTLWIPLTQMQVRKHTCAQSAGQVFLIITVSVVLSGRGGEFLTRGSVINARDM